MVTCNSYITAARDFPEIYTLSPWAANPFQPWYNYHILLAWEVVNEDRNFIVQILESMCNFSTTFHPSDCIIMTLKIAPWLLVTNKSCHSLYAALIQCFHCEWSPNNTRIFRNWSYHKRLTLTSINTLYSKLINDLLNIFIKCMLISILYLSTTLFSFKVVEVEACGLLTPYCKSGHILY